MKISSLTCAAALALAAMSADAAIVGFGLDGANDAGSTYGSVDTFNGAAAGVNTINGTTANFFLEALDPGLNWGHFVLTITSASDANRTGTASAFLGSLSGTLTSSTDNDPGNSSLLNGWTYVFDFAGTLPGNGYTSLTLGGFGTGIGADRAATAVLQATAVPEPETYALMLAGLGVVGAVARRRQRAR